MRVEIRLEDDDREWAVSLECDKVASPKYVCELAVRTLDDLIGQPFVLPHQR